MTRRIVMIGAPLLAVAMTGVLWLLGAWPFGTRTVHEEAPPEAAPGQPWFVDVTPASGITFRHFDPATSQHLIQETMGSGIAWIDYDNDGWPDLFCVQSAPLQGEPSTSLPTSRLFRNNRDGTFSDVTEEVGLRCQGFGMGCAVGTTNL